MCRETVVVLRWSAYRGGRCKETRCSFIKMVDIWRSQLQGGGLCMGVVHVSRLNV